ncbi:hypothetical protein SAMN05421823_10325 [Catalinimonas alkaloidigena]|uniref:Sulfotransferase family protein n=1 Tax=Catalinimonas alkaloidigena TaxID=1075417 RepID=A0A1G9D7J3_9BACT|nr:hypothetical protein [Catalinimonas alkaloidigena]SDK59694.1 hypothetical protein SAMN05421823_10325 [Catalinimonas alkaloidigena]
MIINLISSPRNISTALMYSFAQRHDMRVVDEPFYAHYLQSSGAEHPGRDEVLQTMEKNASAVVKQLQEASQQTPHLFIKNMAHHLIRMELSFLAEWENVLLIRNPRQLIASFAAVLPQPTMRDIGVDYQCQLYNIIERQTGNAPVVIDSGILLQNPADILAQLCAALQLPFDEAMLSWEAGPLPEDGVWAKYWYKNVHQSTGFSSQPTSTRPLPAHCEPLYEAAMPFYEKLFEHSLKPTHAPEV